MNVSVLPRLALLVSVLAVACSDDPAEVTTGSETTTATSSSSSSETSSSSTDTATTSASSSESSSSSNGATTTGLDSSSESTGTGETTQSDTSSSGETMPAGACDPEDGDSACLECTKSSCCAEYEACLADAACDCTRTCLNAMPDTPYAIIGPGCLLDCGAVGIPPALFPALSCQDTMCDGCVTL